MVHYIILQSFTDDLGFDWEIRQYPAGYVVLEPKYDEIII